MHKRTQEERIFGSWLVVIGDEYERFYKENDAKEYLKFCINNGMSAYIHHIESNEKESDLYVS